MRFEAAPVVEAAPAPAPAPAPAAEAPAASDVYEPPSDASTTPPAMTDDISQTPPVYELIPLAVTLPDGFTQVGFDQDHGQSIYFIEDRYNDDVIIRLERTGLPEDLSNMVEIDLGGLTAFGKQTGAFSLLMFSRGDVLYTLTSQHDINTLIRLSAAFV